MDSDSEEFFDAEDSFKDSYKESLPRIMTYNELKEPDFKLTSSVNKLTQMMIKPRESQPQIRAVAGLTIKFQSKGKSEEFRNIRLIQDIDLLEKQEFTSWIMKFSEDCSHLSISGTGRAIYVYNLDKNSIWFMSPSPERLLHGHCAPVTGLSWNKGNNLISSDLEGVVIVWDITCDEPINIYKHPDAVTACKFFKGNDDCFVTVCKDKLLRIYSLKDSKPLGYFQLPSQAYCLEFDADASLLAVGLSKGEVLLYSIIDVRHLRIFTQVLCRNRRGVLSSGRRVVSIAFLSKELMLVSTLDSRIRIINTEGTMLHKFKGHKNGNYGIDADYSRDGDCIMTGSEDGKIYLWKIDPTAVKNYKYECFDVRNKRSPEFALFAPQKILDNVRTRFNDGLARHVIFTIGGKDTLKVYLILS